MGNGQCCGQAANDNKSSIQLKSESSRCITMGLDNCSVTSPSKIKWPSCNQQQIIKIGSQCLLKNQKDISNGISAKEINSKKRMSKVGNLNEAKQEDGDIQEEEEDGNWQQFIEEQTKTASPERLVDHFKQMKKDLKIIKYFVIKNYQEIVEDQSNERMGQYQHNWEQKCKQSKKLEGEIDKLESEIEAIQIDNEKTSNNAKENNQNQVLLAKQGNLINLEEALLINNDTVLENKQLNDRHKQFIINERARQQQVLNVLDQIISSCDQQLQENAKLVSDSETSSYSKQSDIKNSTDKDQAALGSQIQNDTQKEKNTTADKRGSSQPRQKIDQ